MERALGPQIIAVFFCRLLLNTCRRFVYPFAPALGRELDVPLSAITSIIAAGQFTSLPGIFGGLVADRLGHRRMMLTGLLVLSSGMLLCWLLPVYAIFFAGLVMASLGKTIFDPAIQAYIGNTVPFSRRGRVIGIIETAWAGSTLVGIPVLGLLLDSFGLRHVFLLLGGLGICCTLLLAKMIPVDTPGESSGSLGDGFRLLGSLLRNRAAAGMISFGFWISIANDCLFVTYGVWFENVFQVSLVSLGFSTIAIGCAELTGEMLTATIADRVGPRRSLMVGMVLVILAYLLLPYLGFSLMAASAGLFLIFLFFEFTIVTSFALSTELVPTARATMMAGFYAMAGVGRMLGVLAGGWLWQQGGISLVTLCSASFTALGLLSLIWGLAGWKSGEEEVSR